MTETNINTYWLFVVFLACSACDPSSGGFILGNVSGGGYGQVSPSRFHNAVRARNTTENLADLAVASCSGARAAQANEVATQARNAAQNVDAAMSMFNETAEGAARVADAMKVAAAAGRIAYYMVISCGGIPPEIPNIPGYTETFWDIASP